MDDQLEARLRDLERVEDPVERFQRAAALIEESRLSMEQARLIRKQAIDEMRNTGMTYEEIGQRLGISRQRVNDLHKGRGEATPPVLQAAIAVVTKDSDVLLVCRRVTDAGEITWQFPAGVVKPGAAPETVAVSETLAETGVHCKVLRNLGDRIHPITGVLCHYLLCDYLAGEPENRDQQENAATQWVARTELTRFIAADTIYPPVREALEVR